MSYDGFDYSGCYQDLCKRIRESYAEAFGRAADPSLDIEEMIESMAAAAKRSQNPPSIVRNKVAVQRLDCVGVSLGGKCKTTT